MRTAVQSGALKHLLPGTAVAVAERYADGVASDDDLASERKGAPFPNEYAEWVVGTSAYDGAWLAVEWLANSRDLMKSDPDAIRHFPIPLDTTVGRSVLLLRDIFGPQPFRRISIAPKVLAWNDGAVGRIADGIYQDRTFELLPKLADALEDAGCSDAELLGHLRSPGPHVRGCWAVDLVLGKS